MKTIEQAKTEFSNKKAFIEKGIEIEVGSGFISGVEFSQRWISFEYEFPKRNQHINIVLNNGNYDAVKIDNNTKYLDLIKKAKLWRPIELK